MRRRCHRPQQPVIILATQLDRLEKLRASQDSIQSSLFVDCHSRAWHVVPRRYVYQKAYVEFFCSPESFRALEARLASAPSVTYMAVNAAGQNASNVPAGAVRCPTLDTL